ncbi:hypothetical protein ASF27_20660 [Methylobacterium sp. Leaf102]|uniref:hypothetical protein n=1 Tax=unclassified Methylobacterium TaxID=2615210 RepID=UPI0006FDC804|nr:MULTISPECIES: hypothetical protein [unclassified Methylobacterium]KQP28862.1 hypothetical protein ASF27_20660 [Methylobacterium sp. Leaf102]KQP62203.1 hypothetical protein ASF52_06020 [Methylobacterium sp. Leaf112]
MNDTQTITGTVWAVFGHRFAIEAKDGRVLADLGPKAAERIAIAPGDTVTITGERKPSETKVMSITLKDGIVREIAWPKPHEEKAGQAPADPSAALAAVKADGYAVEGEPARKPKHFEIVGAKDGVRHEIHVELDGKIRKAKPLAA